MTANKGGLGRPSPRRPALPRRPEPCRAGLGPSGQCHREASAAPAPTKATAAAHGLCPRAGWKSGSLHLHPRSRGSRDGLPAAWAQRRTALLRESEGALHSVLRPAFDSARRTPAHGRFSSGCREAWVRRQPRGREDGPAGHVLPAPRSRSARCCRASAVPRKGRAALRGSSAPLLNPPCKFKSTANKAQSPRNYLF